MWLVYYMLCCGCFLGATSIVFMPLLKRHKNVRAFRSLSLFTMFLAILIIEAIPLTLLWVGLSYVIDYRLAIAVVMCVMFLPWALGTALFNWAMIYAISNVIDFDDIYIEFDNKLVTRVWERDQAFSQTFWGIGKAKRKLLQEIVKEVRSDISGSIFERWYKCHYNWYFLLRGYTCFDKDAAIKIKEAIQRNGASMVIIHNHGEAI